LLQNNPLFGSHSLGSCAKTALERFGQSWEMMKTLMRRALPPMISFPVLYDGIVIECNGKIQTQAIIESWQKELTKRHVLPAPKESPFFWVPLATYTQDSLYSHCINEFYLHLRKMLAYFTY
jgi:hypothetical protein